MVSETSLLIGKIVEILENRFGRTPTEDEVLGFITGSPVDKIKIWNKENK